MNHEEFAAMMQAANKNHEMHQMHQQALNAEFATFIDELSLDQLQTLRTMVALADEGGNASAFYGLITGAIIYKHGRTWNGEDPNALLKQGAAQAEADDYHTGVHRHPEAEPEWVEDSPKDIHDLGSRAIFSVNAPGYVENLSVLMMTEDEIATKRREYGLTVRDNQLVCAGCGMRYVTLTDRMLKAPGIDGCHGCQARAGQG